MTPASLFSNDHKILKFVYALLYFPTNNLLKDFFLSSYSVVAVNAEENFYYSRFTVNVPTNNKHYAIAFRSDCAVHCGKPPHKTFVFY